MCPTPALWLSLLLVACTTTTGDQQPVRIGGALGAVFSTASKDYDDPDRRQDVDEARSGTGFLEFGIEGGDDLLLSRVTYVSSTHDVPGGSGDAQLEQWLAFGLYAPAVITTDHLSLRPLIGFGFGAVHLDFSGTPSPDDATGAAAALAVGLEVELAGHVMLGTMGWYGTTFEPGNTEGDFSTVMLYAGLRF